MDQRSFRKPWLQSTGPFALGTPPRPRLLPPGYPPKIHITPVEVMTAVWPYRAAGLSPEGLLSSQVGVPAWRTLEESLSCN